MTDVTNKYFLSSKLKEQLEGWLEIEQVILQ